MAAVIGTEGERDRELAVGEKTGAAVLHEAIAAVPAAGKPWLAPPKLRPSPSLRKLTGGAGGAIAGVWSPLLLEVAAGLLPNQFGDRRCSGLAVPSSFVLLWLPREWLGAEVAVVGDFGLREEVPVTRLGYGFTF
ncbi:uncharacterized protein DS421_13g414880 [Arachis hypogaea]|nr:uncharacterized protein DS421_13g414880 [Arachis hypogaea]